MPLPDRRGCPGLTAWPPGATHSITAHLDACDVPCRPDVLDDGGGLCLRAQTNFDHIGPRAVGRNGLQSGTDAYDVAQRPQRAARQRRPAPPETSLMPSGVPARLFRLVPRRVRHRGQLPLAWCLERCAALPAFPREVRAAPARERRAGAARLARDGFCTAATRPTTGCGARAAASRIWPTMASSRGSSGWPATARSIDASSRSAAANRTFMRPRVGRELSATQPIEECLEFV